MKAHNEASAWFEEFYKKNKDTHENIPWAKLKVNPLLDTYLQDSNGHNKGKALVIGCGLGDDAYALHLAGFEVLAIDISQTALDLAQERFSDTDIAFEKQDIFDMPDKYKEYFDFVFESQTIQSLPIEFREKMIQAVADTVAKEGRLLVLAHYKEGERKGPPWPLTRKEIDYFQESGVKELSLNILKEDSPVVPLKFRALYTR